MDKLLGSKKKNKCVKKDKYRDSKGQNTVIKFGWAKDHTVSEIECSCTEADNPMYLERMV